MGNWKDLNKKPAGGGAPSPAPAASNVSSASVTVALGMWANASAFGFSGSITLPTSDPDYHRPAFVHVVVALPDGSTDEVCPSLPAGTTTFRGPIKYLQDGTFHTLVLRFLCENEDGVITPSPCSVSVDVDGSAVTAVTAPREVPNTLSADPVTRLVSTTIGGTPVLANNQVPQNVSYWISQDDGATFVWIGWDKIESVGQEIQTRRVTPVTTQQWKLAMAAGAIPGDPTVFIPASALPAGAVVSTSFTVTGLSVPSATLLGVLIVAAPDNTEDPKWPYNSITPDGTQFFSIPQVTVDTSGAVGDPNAFFLRVTAQDCDANHNPIGPEQPWDGAVVDGNAYSFGPLMGAYGTQGGSYTRTTNVAYVRLRCYICNRVDGTAASFQNPNCATLQAGVGGGAGYVDVLVAQGGALPLAGIPATRINPATKLPVATVPIGPGLTNNGSAVVPNLGTGVGLGVGNGIQINLGSGLAAGGGNTVVVYVGSGLINNGQVVVNAGNGVSTASGPLSVITPANSGMGVNSAGIFVYVGAGMTSVGGPLAVAAAPNSGITVGGGGVGVVASAGVQVSAAGISIKLTATSGLTADANGVAANVGGGLQAGIQITIASGGVTDDKVATIDVGKLTVNGALTVGAGGITMTGAGGLLLVGGGSVNANPGSVYGMSIGAGNAVVPGFYKVGSTTVIDTGCNANFVSVKIQGGVKIDSAANFFTNACHVYGLLDFNGGTSSSATAGGAGPLPSLPDGYINMQVAGTNKRIPYYAV